MWFVAAALAQDPDPKPDVTVNGYVEGYYSWNFNRPENGVTNLRGFDNRAETLSLSNVALGVTGERGPVKAHATFQAGLTPNTYTLAETSRAATGGVGETDRFTWRLVQQAWVAWAASDTVTAEAGLFLSPIGPESMGVKDNWNFSRSNQFFGLPFYHTGARIGWQASEAVKLTIAGYNGWNTVVDNNRAKSVSLQLNVTTGAWTGSVLYFGGIERNPGATEGAPWRNSLDTWWQLDANDRWSFLVHANGGLESNQLGTSRWGATAGYVRYAAVPEKLYVVARGDVFAEVAPIGASTIFWPATDDAGLARVAEGTLTLDWRPTPGLSVRLEGRHDDANVPMFFDSSVTTDPVSGADIPDARAQDTLTAGVVAWF